MAHRYFSLLVALASCCGLAETFSSLAEYFEAHRAIAKFGPTYRVQDDVEFDRQLWYTKLDDDQIAIINPKKSWLYDLAPWARATRDAVNPDPHEFAMAETVLTDRFRGVDFIAKAGEAEEIWLSTQGTRIFDFKGSYGFRRKNEKDPRSEVIRYDVPAPKVNLTRIATPFPEEQARQILSARLVESIDELPAQFANRQEENYTLTFHDKKPYQEVLKKVSVLKDPSVQEAAAKQLKYFEYINPHRATGIDGYASCLTGLWKALPESPEIPVYHLDTFPRNFRDLDSLIYQSRGQPPKIILALAGTRMWDRHRLDNLHAQAYELHGLKEGKNTIALLVTDGHDKDYDLVQPFKIYIDVVHPPRPDGTFVEKVHDVPFKGEARVFTPEKTDEHAFLDILRNRVRSIMIDLRANAKKLKTLWRDGGNTLYEAKYYTEYCARIMMDPETRAEAERTAKYLGELYEESERRYQETSKRRSIEDTTTAHRPATGEQTGTH